MPALNTHAQTNNAQNHLPMFTHILLACKTGPNQTQQFNSRNGDHITKIAGQTWLIHLSFHYGAFSGFNSISYEFESKIVNKQDGANVEDAEFKVTTTFLRAADNQSQTTVGVFKVHRETNAMGDVMVDESSSRIAYSMS